jgi:H+-transporting ATPase
MAQPAQQQREGNAEQPGETAPLMARPDEKDQKDGATTELANLAADMRKQYAVRASQGYALRDSQGNIREAPKFPGVKKFSLGESISHLDGEGELKKKEEKGAEFIYNEVGLTDEEAAVLLEKVGKNELPDNTTPDWKLILTSLVQPMPLMIWAAAIIEAAIENWPDMGILLGIQATNCTISFYETKKAGNAVAALKKSLKPRATVKRRKNIDEEGKFCEIDGTLLVPGDCVLLASGSAIPADCRINNGTIDVDQSGLTGESLPVTMHARSEDPEHPNPHMGSTCVKGEVEATVEGTGKDTELGRAAQLLTGAKERSSLEKLLLKIIFVLLVMSLTLCIIVLVYLLVQGETVKSALSFAVVLLVASIPLAIEIVCTTTLALGSRELTKHGAIVSRLSSIEDMAALNLLCSDKTGTLTLNQMMIQDETPLYFDGENRTTVLRFAAMAAKWKEPARDALDKLVLGDRTDHKLNNPDQVCADLDSLANVKQTDYVPFDANIKRTEGTVIENGQEFKVTKGAPHVLAALISDKGIHDKVMADVQALGKRGIRSLAVARTLTKEGEWHMLGLLTFLDPPRPDTKDTIASAREYGVPTKMITGDHLLIAKETAKQLGMGTNILGPESLPLMEGRDEPPNLVKVYGKTIAGADGFAQVYPSHKYLVVSALRKMGFRVGMTGDGVNDAPALKRADVGIAVQGATDAARAAADIVLTQPGLSTIVHGIKIARQIFQRMQNFLTYRIAATMQLLVFFFVAVLSWKPNEMIPRPFHPQLHHEEWPPFFRMPVLLLMLITLLNDGTLIAIGYDHVNTSPYPETWNLPVRFLVSGVLGFVAFASSILILYGALDSWAPGSWFQQLAITPPGLGLQYGQVTTMIYLKVSVSDFLTLFAARTGESFFWVRAPSLILFIAACVALLSSSLIAAFLPIGTLDDQAIEGLGILTVYVWIYCIIWFLIQDVFKVLTYKLLRRFHILGYGKPFVMAGVDPNAPVPEPTVIVHH